MAIRELGLTFDGRSSWTAVAELCAAQVSDACLVSVQEEGGGSWQVAGGAVHELLRRQHAVSGDAFDRHVLAPHHLAIPLQSPSACDVPGYTGLLQLHWFSSHSPGLSDLALAQIVVDHAIATIHGARVAEQLRRDHDRAVHLETALASNRDIGMAMGIVMARHLLSSEEAFTVLRRISQLQHRKLRDVASDIVLTGCLPERVSTSDVLDLTVKSAVPSKPAMSA